MNVNVLQLQDLNEVRTRLSTHCVVSEAANVGMRVSGEVANLGRTMSEWMYLFIYCERQVCLSRLEMSECMSTSNYEQKCIGDREIFK